jgi:hypothetical protein
VVGLWCLIGNLPDSCALAVTFTPWLPATVLKCPPEALPARGTLSVRDVRITTRMSRTIRYLIPEFIALTIAQNKRNQAAPH